MKNTIPACLIGVTALLFGGAREGNYQVVEGEEYHYVVVSLKDISRIVCDKEISGVTYSKDKEIEIKKEGRNLYVKILPKKITMPSGKEKIKISDFPREIFVECGGQVFSLILIPKEVPSRTIVLKVPQVDDKKAREFLRGKPYVDTMLELIGHAYREVPPPGFDVEEINKPFKEFKELSLTLRKVYRGGPYEVQEYLVTAKMDVTIHEGAFIPHLKRPLAISVVTPTLMEGETTRLFVVTRRVPEN